MQFITRILALFFPISLLGLLRRKVDLPHEWAMMSSDQLAVLQQAYDYGKPYGLAESMRAICWQESTGGLLMENKKDGTTGSYGHFGINPVIMATREFETQPYRPTDEQIKICKRKLKDFYEGANQCRLELEYWIDIYVPGEWSKVWASYNAGHELANGEGYARDIKAKIMFLRRKP